TPATTRDGVSTSEVQQVLVTGSGGTFTLTANGQTTGTLQYNDTAANVQAALTGLTSIGAGNVFVTRAHFAEEQVVTVLGAVGGSFTLTFNGQTTTALLFNDTAANVQSALNALSSIGGVGGSVTVTQVGNTYVVV